MNKDLSLIFIGSNALHAKFRECYSGQITPTDENGYYKTTLSFPQARKLFYDKMPLKTTTSTFLRGEGDVSDALVISDNRHTESMRLGAVVIDGEEKPCYIAVTEEGVALLVTSTTWIVGRKVAQYRYVEVSRIPYTNTHQTTMARFGTVVTAGIDALIDLLVIAEEKQIKPVTCAKLQGNAINDL